MNEAKFIETVKSFEGFRAHAYRCPAGVLTIGYGRTENVKLGDVTSQAKEEAWLLKKIASIMKEVSNYMTDRGYKLTDYQLQALTSFTYNCGLGNLYKLTDKGKRTVEEISEKIPSYNKGGGRLLAGLVRRRAWEKDLFDGLLEKEEKKSPTAKDLQQLVNELSGSDLVIDGKFGKKSITATYNYLNARHNVMEVENGRDN